MVFFFNAEPRQPVFGSFIFHMLKIELYFSKNSCENNKNVKETSFFSLQNHFKFFCAMSKYNLHIFSRAGVKFTENIAEEKKSDLANVKT